MKTKISTLPRVSEILDLLCPLQAGRLSEAELNIKATHGTLVHRLCHQVANHRLSWESVPESPIKQKAMIFERFLRDTQAQIIWSEKRLSCHTFRGTPDLLAELHGRDTVIDIKTGPPQLRHRVQIAAYYRLVRVTDIDRYIPDAAILYLKDDRYKVEYIPADEIAAHIDAFHAQLVIWRWKNRFKRNPVLECAVEAIELERAYDYISGLEQKGAARTKRSRSRQVAR